MWKKMKAMDFLSHSEPIYKKGFISNFVEFTVIGSAFSLEDTLYAQYLNSSLIGAIRIDNKKENYRFVSILKTSCSFQIRNLYSKTLEEAKFKSDLFLIDQGFKIKFPGV